MQDTVQTSCKFFFDVIDRHYDRNHYHIATCFLIRIFSPCTHLVFPKCRRNSDTKWKRTVLSEEWKERHTSAVTSESEQKSSFPSLLSKNRRSGWAHTCPLRQAENGKPKEIERQT